MAYYGGKKHSMREKISWHNGRSKNGGYKGAYSRGYVKGAYAAKKELVDYYENKLKKVTVKIIKSGNK